MAKDRVPFPQANEINKIFMILNIEKEDLLGDLDYLTNYLGFSSNRQTYYYISACVFLGILDDSKHFTEFGIQIRKSPTTKQKFGIITRVISSPIFSEAFLNNYLFGEVMNIEQIADLIHLYYGIDNDEVCIRRASTVYNWLNWIYKERKSR